MITAIVKLPDGRSKCVQLNKEIQVKDLTRLTVKNDVLAACCYVVCGGHRLSESDTVQNGCVYHIIPRLLGGKGGFGSMLRAIGAQIEKTTNREACRDLSGRRMRDMNNEQKLREWVAKQAEREREKEERRKARMERRRAQPKHIFHDPNYSAQMSSTAEEVRDAVLVGLQKSSTSSQPSTSSGQSRKRKARDEPDFDVKKVASEWLGMDIDLDQLSSDSDSDSESGSCPESSEPQASTNQSETAAQPTVATSQSETASQLTATSSQSETASQSTTAASQSETALQTCSSDKTGAEAQAVEPQNLDEKTENKSTCGSSNETNNVTTSNGSAVEQDRPSHQKGSAAAASTTVPSSGEQPNKLLAALADHPPQQEASKKRQQPAATVDLDAISSPTELEDLGLDALKMALQSRGLKCSGTLQDRAQRLWAIKGLQPDQIPASFFPKPAKGKGKKK